MKPDISGTFNNRHGNQTAREAAEAARRAGMTLGEWLDTVIRKDEPHTYRDSAGRREDSPYGRDHDGRRADFSGPGRAPRASAERSFDRDQAGQDRRGRRGKFDRRTEDALHAVERWLRDGEGKTTTHGREDSERLTEALDMITRRLDNLDERITESGSAEISAIRDTMDRLEHRIEDVTHAALHAGQHGRDRFQEELERRVADIGRRIEDMGRNQSNAGNARLEKLEGMIASMARALDDRQPVARPVMNGPRRRAHMLSTTSAGGASGQTLNQAMAEIHAHKLRLEQTARGSSPSDLGRNTVEDAHERAYDRVAPAFETIRTEIAKLANRISDVRSQPDISDLRAELSELRAAVSRAVENRADPQPALPEVLDQISSRMQQEFAAMNRAVHDRLDAAMHHDSGSQKLAQLVPALDTLSQRLETSGSRMATDLRRDFQTAITDLRQAVVQQRPAISIEPVEKAIRDLAERIDGLSSQPGVDSAVLVRTNLELAEMREMLGKAGNPLALDRIERQVSALTQKLDVASTTAQSVSRADIESLSKEVRHLARQFDPALALSAMDDKLRALEDRIGRRLESLNFAGEATSASGDILMPDMSGIERMMHALSDKIDAARQPQAGLDQIEGLQRQIAQIASRLERTDEGTLALASIERAVSDLFTQIDGLRNTQRETAEMAAEQAARLLSQNLDTRVQSNLATHAIAAADPAPQIAALADDVNALFQARESVDRKTQNTLEAVHGALEQIVGRLNSLETEVTAQTKRPVEPMPVRAAIEAATQAAQDMGKPLPRGMEARTAASKPATGSAAPQPAPGIDPTVLAKPGSRRSQPVPVEPEAKPSRFALKLPFLKGKGDKAEPQVKQPVLQSENPFAKTDAAAMPQNQALAGGGDIPLEPGSGRPGAEGEIGARLVAAARRAAQSAAHETAAAKNEIKSEAKSARTKIAKAGEGETKSFLAARKKPILLGLAALTMAILSLNIVSSMMSPKSAVPASSPAMKSAVQVQKETIPQRIAPESIPEAVKPPEAAKQSAVQAPADPTSVGTVMDTGKPLVITPGGNSLLNPSPLNPPSMEMTKEIASPPAAAPVPPSVAALAPAEMPAGIVSAGLKAGVQRGDVAALYEVGNRLFEGRGVARDPKQAIMWFERAGQAGLVPAQFRVGNMYEKGIGVARDLKQARQWYGRAADKGNAKAIHNLGVIIAEGGDGKPDYTVASDLFRRAAQFGIRDSQYNIAILLARGLGTGQSMTEAYTWFALAAAQGDDEAGRKRDEVAARLSPEDLAAAKDAVAKFKPLALDALANDVPERTWDAAPAAPAGKPKTSNRVTGSARI